MYFSLVFFSIVTIFSTLAVPSKYDRLEQKLVNISMQLDRIELQLNNSLNQLMEKLDDNTLDIISSVSSARVSQRNGRFFTSHVRAYDDIDFL